MRRLSLAVLIAAVACATPHAAPPPAPVPTTTTQAPPASPQSPNRMTPATSVAKTIKEPRIRVGLQSDQSDVEFDRIAGGYYIVSDAGASILKRGFTATPPLADTDVRYGIQVSAVSDQTSADALVQKLQQSGQQTVTSVFNATTGTYRVLVGDFVDEQSAVPLRTQLQQQGYSDMPIVRRPADHPFEKVHKIVDDEGVSYTIRGESILIMPVTEQTISIGDQQYRTAARLFINSRGLYNVINELNLEDYLYGVVPAEMGPKIFDELEALKAQAVAARTYAVRNLRGFGTEGYDICAGPACQAYNGFSGEDPLTDRAVNETAGQVITYQGKLIDALYTSTCGGETSDVSTMFPGRNEPYLKRARCVEMDMTTIAGRADSGELTQQQADARTFASIAGLPDQASSWSARDVERAVLEAQRILGSTETDVVNLASSRRGDVLRYLAALLRLDEKARVTTLPEDRQYFFPDTASREQQEYLAAAFLMKFGILPAQNIDRIDLNAAIPRDELYALLKSWLREHTAVQENSGKILSVTDRTVTLKAEGKTQRFTLPPNIPIFRRLGDRLQEYAQVPVMLGDRAFVYTGFNKAPLAMIVQGNLDGASFDRTSSFANWTRSYRAEELVPIISRRNTIQQLVDIRPVTVDASQRVAELEVTAEGGRKFILRGLPIRWSLGIPDNLFVYEKTKDPDGMDRYTFFGKGWGHGVGFCQVGSYGMAFRGWTYDRILTHYYTGVEIVPMERASR